jgi:hypothetical protein
LYRNPLIFGLKLINIKNPKIWITDATNGFINEEEDTIWLLEYFVPKAIESSIEKIIFIVGDDALLKKEIDSQVKPLSQYFEVEVIQEKQF